MRIQAAKKNHVTISMVFQEIFHPEKHGNKTYANMAAVV
jgi:hypothetical protein